MRDLVMDLQRNDDWTQAIVERLKSKRHGRVSEAWALGSNGELFHKERLFVPAEETAKQEIFRLYHDYPLAGHFGVERTLERIQRKYFWNDITKSVRDHCQSCQVCQLRKPRKHRPYGDLQSLYPSKPYQELSMDSSPDYHQRGPEMGRGQFHSCHCGQIHKDGTLLRCGSNHHKPRFGSVVLRRN